MKPNKIKQVSFSIIFLLFIIALSYWNIRNKAEKTFKPFLETELYYYGTQFQPFTLYYENDKIKKWYGPNWYVSYDHQTVMTSGALSIRYNLWGKVLDVNPGNLLNEILPNLSKFN
ncbi:MAG: hypothetical protein OCC45_02495 [Desulfotalea sp.]